MNIGERLRSLRESKNLSQGDIENRTGLKRCYISRVEHGHTVPSVDTLQKIAVGLEVPVYQLFYDGDEPVKPIFNRESDRKPDWASKGRGKRLLGRFRLVLSKMTEKDRALLLYTAQKLVILHNGRH